MPPTAYSLSSPPANVPAPVTLPVAAAGREGFREGPARGWFLFAIGSLVLAGLLSLMLVVGRLPFLGWLFTDPLFFKRALVVHVDLAIVVWFQAGTLAFLGLALGPRMHRAGVVIALGLAGMGLAGLISGALMPGAMPVLSNYVPVIDHPMFFAGLICWFSGAGLFFAQALATPSRTDAKAFAPPVVMALRASAAANVLALLTFIASWLTTPVTLPAAYYELLFWGGGHVLQVGNVAAMVALWLHLLRRWAGIDLLSTATTTALMAALVLPQAILPLLAFTGTTTTIYFSMATHLMRWTIFPVVLVVMIAGFIHVRRSRAGLSFRDHRFAGLAGSAILTLLGFLLGAMIRGSSTLVPGHYHCAIGAVTIALMAAAYDFCTSVASKSAAVPEPRWARLQLILFGTGQAVFGLGFAWAGAYGLGRKQYGAEQHVRTLGEYLGLSVMGIGGIVAVAGGIFFLTVMVRRINHWRHAGSAFSHSNP